ncbi:MAG: DUF1778 domain-containing protein [Acidimicrobiia bacterium]|nr:DUF1778 domain-containing protein [Acidimicrobiia bacterium]
MAVKTERLEARVSPEERARLEWAARVAGTSVSTFVIDAAVDRAEVLIAAEMSTTVPAAYFESLLEALDEPDDAPTLTRAARRMPRARRTPTR